MASLCPLGEQKVFFLNLYVVEVRFNYTRYVPNTYMMYDTPYYIIIIRLYKYNMATLVELRASLFLNNEDL